jgi:hypothetical protein
VGVSANVGAGIVGVFRPEISQDLLQVAHGLAGGTQSGVLVEAGVHQVPEALDQVLANLGAQILGGGQVAIGPEQVFQQAVDSAGHGLSSLRR